MEAYAHTDDGTWFVPTEHCRGPWDEQSCHAGPPTGLLARSMELALLAEGGGHQLVRLTAELLRPIPMAGFSVTATLDRAGRATASVDAVLRDADGREVAVARGVAITPRSLGAVPSASFAPPELEGAVLDAFPLRSPRHELPSFLGSTQVRYPKGEDPEPGPTTVWMKALPLVAGETPSPFQAICPLADCGNALSRNAEPSEWGFVNPDLTIALHRDPAGEWFGASSVSHWQSSGIGMSDTLLFDADGAVGRAVQTLLLTPPG